MVDYYVDGSEYEDYVASNPEENIVKVPSGVQGNVARIRNYILDQNTEADVIVLLDDDIKNMGYWKKSEKIIIDKDLFFDFIKIYSVLCNDFGFRMWGVNVNNDKLSYREFTPFNTSSFVGGPFQVFLKGSDLRYDESLPLKEDYDMLIQQCNKYRGVLRVNRFFYDCKQSQQMGGVANMRNYKKEQEQFDLLQKKWGSKIVKYDKKGKKNSTNIDYNPIIKIPIKGV